ncbi:hypothetical protein ACSLV1_31930 [Pseudomonas aeruginosa]|uniref:hypothetical protein n=1 Tax=Pseudomonas aeruginosa TaxID=287 RepID=UPI001BD317FD|nr:hypothetical protein [Pseudomonas aeruginosa]
MTKANECTCPSGDGSLRHPCPAHPALVEQAGGDERAAFRPAQVISYRPGVGEVTIYVAGRVPGYMNIGDTVYVSDRAPVEQPIAALAQPSPVRSSLLINGYQLRAALDFIAPDGTAEQLESEACIEWRQQDADFLEAGLYAFCAEYPEEGGVLLDEEPTTAQPSRVQAEQHWPKLEKPAQVGAIRFHAGLSSRLVVEAAQRLYEFESTPEKEAERIERLQAFREQLDPLNLAQHAKAFNEAPAEALKPGQAEEERPKIVATLFTPNEKVHDDIGFKAFAVAGDCDKDGGEFYDPEKLMTVAQHERIVGALRTKADQLREALEWRKENQAGQRELLRSVTAERDAALARVAELESKLAELEMQAPVAFLYRGTDMGDQLTIIRLDHYWRPKYSTEEHDYIKGIPLYAAPVAQAQHSVPELDQSRSALTEAQMRRLYDNSTEAENEQLGFAAFARLMRRAEAVHQIAAAPGKEVGHE